jgi:YedE family putative selenium metabolism protein
MLRREGSLGQAMPAVLAVGVIGALSAVLVAAGNPGNMGVCGACFLRDLAGALRLTAAPAPAIFRPELVGLVFGALLFRLLSRRFEARSGSHAVTRFFLGLIMGGAALVFLGCPFRMLQRLGGGDLNAWLALPGFILGTGAAKLLEKRGYTLGKTAVVAPQVGLIPPIVYAILLVMFLAGGFLAGPALGVDTPPAHAGFAIALAIGALAGGVLSWSGFCCIAAGRQVWAGGGRMLLAAGLFIGAYAVVALVNGKGNWSLSGQPIAHGDWLWNFLALALLGLTGAFAGGCPVRQLVMSGEGNGDAMVTTAGILLGGALAHNFGVVSKAMSAESSGGVTSGGELFLIASLALVLAYALGVVRSVEKAASSN